MPAKPYTFTFNNRMHAYTWSPVTDVVTAQKIINEIMNTVSTAQLTVTQDGLTPDRYMYNPNGTHVLGNNGQPIRIY